jgi:nucleoside-triphosphatase
MLRNLLITGRPGVGKTTLVMRVVDSLDKGVAGGFYTQEIREGRHRVGFIAKTVDGRSQILAHVDIKSRFRVGRYGVDVGAIDDLIVSSIDDAIKERKVVIIDEIGKMELFSERFRQAVLQAMDSQRVVIATIAVYNNEFLRALKERRDVRLFELDIENREGLFMDVMEKVRALL